MIGRQEWSDGSLTTIIAKYLSMFAADDSFDAIQIKCDREVSRGAFVFVDECKRIMFCFSLTTCEIIGRHILRQNNAAKVVWLNLFKAAE